MKRVDVDGVSLLLDDWEITAVTLMPPSGAPVVTVPDDLLPMVSLGMATGRYLEVGRQSGFFAFVFGIFLPGLVLGAVRAEGPLVVAVAWLAVAVAVFLIVFHGWTWWTRRPRRLQD